MIFSDRQKLKKLLTSRIDLQGILRYLGRRKTLSDGIFFITSFKIISTQSKNNNNVLWDFHELKCKQQYYKVGENERVSKGQGQAAPRCTTLASRSVRTENKQGPKDSERHFDLLPPLTA